MSTQQDTTTHVLHGACRLMKSPDSHLHEGSAGGTARLGLHYACPRLGLGWGHLMETCSLAQVQDGVQVQRFCNRSVAGQESLVLPASSPRTLDTLMGHHTHHLSSEDP